ncbi:Putative glycosyl transferase [Methanosarcina barkeri str. Wiesmoor]|uniref:Glycosyltransferase n=2 Tax=Methanosarcina barkeri TaxID=2208 RepID=Q46CB1_METBF|nr:bifunctional polysaccharide deacetylase/glycosyltransferase family 2 protein [Methanosarcina barkeri]AKB52453.1 Putative glycosyl transferase [Methanosarcina barkeri str. Wiesmoor]
MSKKQLADFEKSQENYVVNQSNVRFTQKEAGMIEKKFPGLSNKLIFKKKVPLISFFLAILITLPLGVFLCTEVNHLNDAMFGRITILDEPELLNALRNAQDRGVIMGVHGWEHENYSTLKPFQAKENVEKGKLVFEKAGLVPRVFISPFDIYGIPTDPSVRQAIESTKVATRLPSLKTNGTHIDEYTWNWRTMESFDDPRFQAASAKIREDHPQTIVLHAMDWNPYVNQFLIDYLSSTDEKNITVRMDDVEVNTPKDVITGISQMTKYKSVGRVVLAIIPVGTWKGGNPAIGSLEVNKIMVVYFWFFIITSLLPLSFFVIWKFLSGWNIRRSKNSCQPQNIQDTGYHGLVSIIVPAYDEEKTIGSCLESILNQDYNGEMEVIVVNDGSTDRTAEIVLKYPVKFIDLKANVGKANALNRAIEDAKGDILIFTDSDSYMSANAVSSLVECLITNNDAQIVAGNVFIHNSQGKKRIMKYFQMIEYLIEQEITRYLQSLSGNILVCPGPLTAVKREVCESVRFSDETIVEDADFTIKALKKSMKIIREPKAKVYTNAPETFRAWYKQRKRWWYGNLQVWRLHRHWAMRNAWMVLNYLGYIIGVCSIILVMFLPYLLLQYDNLLLISLRGLSYSILPVLIFIVFTASLFSKDKKLLPMLIPYVLVYSTIKVVTISYLYLCYLTGRGLKIQFGPRIIEVR